MDVMGIRYTKKLCEPWIFELDELARRDFRERSLQVLCPVVLQVCNLKHVLKENSKWSKGLRFNKIRCFFVFQFGYCTEMCCRYQETYGILTIEQKLSMISQYSASDPNDAVSPQKVANLYSQVIK